MNEYILYYLLTSLSLFLAFCMYGRKTKDPIQDWSGEGWAGVLIFSFIPVFGSLFLFCALIGPELIKERTLKRDKTFMKDSMLKGIGDDTIQIE